LKKAEIISLIDIYSRHPNAQLNAGNSSPVTTAGFMFSMNEKTTTKLKENFGKIAKQLMK
jgi:hypothetical protein